MTTFLRLLGRRILSTWRLFVALAVGTTVAAALMAATVIYADSLEVLGLDFALDQQSDAELNVQASASGRITRGEVDRTMAVLDDGMGRFIFPVLTERVRILESGTFYIAPAGEPIDIESDLRPRAFLQTRGNLEQNITIVEGTLPAPGEGDVIPVAIGASAAAPDRLDLAVGDEFDILPFWALDQEPLRLRVTAIIEPIDPASDYWTGSPEAFDVRSTRWDTFAFFTHEDVLVDEVASQLPGMPGDMAVLGRVNPDSIHPSDVGGLLNSLGGFRGTMDRDLATSRFVSDLPSTLESFRDRLTFSRIPLFLVALQVVGIAVFYLVMVSVLHVSRQSGEIALLKSRGGTSRQVLMLYIGEGLVLLVVAVLLAPPLAALAVALLGRTNVFSDLTGGGNLEVTLTFQAYLVALGGALAGLVALIVPAYLASRSTIVGFKRTAGRPAVAAFLFRYYIDLAVVAVAGLVLFELQSEGNLASRNVFGELETDPVLLIAPALFFLVTGFLFLRLFPIILRLIGFVVGQLKSTSLALAFSHLIRNPTRYGLIILLLVLATSLGMFAATFGSTLNSNLRDRAHYEVGASARVPNLRPSNQDKSQYEAALATFPNIESFTTVLRENGSFQLDRLRSVDADIFGIDERLAETAYFRDDFAAMELSDIVATVIDEEFVLPTGPAVPEDLNGVGIWLFAGQEHGAFDVHVQIRDGINKVHDLTLVPIGADGLPLERVQGTLPYEDPAWGFWVADLEQEVRGGLIHPLTVDSVTIKRPVRRGDDRSIFVFDNLSALTWDDSAALDLDALGATVLSGFEEPGEWDVVTGHTRERLSDFIEPNTNTVFDGASALSIIWTEPVSPLVQRGFRVPGPTGAIPVAASTGFLLESGLNIGDQFTVFSDNAYMLFEVVADLEYFPTVAQPEEDPFLLVDQDVYVYLASRVPGTIGGPGVHEVWIDATSAGIDTEGLLAVLPADAEEVLLLTDALFEREQDPLAVAGWQGILLVSFGAVLLLSAIGFVLFSYLSAQSRRLEFGILRTLGLTRGQVGVSVAIEQFIIVALGLIAGSLIALQLGPTMIDFLGFTEEGEGVVPPYRNVTDWTTLGLTYGTILAVFVTATVAIITLYLREAIHRVLRIGEV